MIIKWWNNSLPYQPALTPGNSCELLSLTNIVPAATVSSLGAVTLIQREILICCMLLCVCVRAADLENKWWGWGVRRSEPSKIITLAHSWWINCHLKKNTDVSGNPKLLVQCGDSPDFKCKAICLYFTRHPQLLYFKKKAHLLSLSSPPTHPLSICIILNLNEFNFLLPLGRESQTTYLQLHLLSYTHIMLCNSRSSLKHCNTTHVNTQWSGTLTLDV